MKVRREIIGVMSFILLQTTVVCADSEFSNEVKLKSRNIFSSDVDVQNGKIKIYESEFEFDREWKMADQLPVDFSLNAGHIGIDHDLALELPAHLESRSVGIGTKVPAPLLDHEHYFIGVDVYPTLNTDDGDWKSGAFRIPFRAYLIYKRDENFIIVAGLKVRPQYDAVVIPVIGFIYKPDGRLSFNIASSDPNISYQLTDKTNVIWEFNFTSEEYEVTRGAQNGVVLKYQETSMGFGVEHRFTKNIKANASVGGVFNRRLEYKDGQGKVVPDSGVYAGAKINVDF